MEKEVFFSGFCRQSDQIRMVTVEIYDGELEVDCCYFGCPFAPNCTIAQSIKELEEQE